MELGQNLIQRINVADSLARSAAARPGHPALVDGDRSWTYAEFDSWVDRLARGLAARGYARGNALALASANSAEFLAVYYACGRLGVVCVPINLGWRADEVAYVLGHSSSRGIVIEAQLVGPLSDAVTKVSDVADVIVIRGTGEWEAQPADRNWSTLDEV
jgi:long-chain acyl-CoA synthetase